MSRTGTCSASSPAASSGPIDGTGVVEGAMEPERQSAPVRGHCLCQQRVTRR